MNLHQMRCSPKKICHHLLAHMLFQTLMVLNILLYIFWEMSQCFIYLLINGTLWLPTFFEICLLTNEKTLVFMCSWSVLEPFLMAESYRGAMFCFSVVVCTFVMFIYKVCAALGSCSPSPLSHKCYSVSSFRPASCVQPLLVVITLPYELFCKVGEKICTCCILSVILRCWSTRVSKKDSLINSQADYVSYECGSEETYWQRVLAADFPTASWHWILNNSLFRWQQT